MLFLMLLYYILVWLSFSVIVDGNKFSIDPVTGLITLTNGLDYETPPNQYEIIITVTDHGVPPLSSTASVRVNVTDINDNPPTIDPPITVKDYYIPEVRTLLIFSMSLLYMYMYMHVFIYRMQHMVILYLM